MAQITALGAKAFYGGKGLSDKNSTLLTRLNLISTQGNQTESVAGTEPDELTTTDATLTTIKTITPAVSSVTMIDVQVVGVRTDVADQVVAYHQKSVYKKSAAGVVTEVANKLETMHEEEAALAGASITTDANAATVRVRVTGIGGATIKWRAYVKTSTESIA